MRRHLAVTALAVLGIASPALATTSGQTLLVSTTPGGGSADHVSYGADVSADGRYVVFTSYADDLVTGPVSGQGDVYRRDVVGGVTELVSVDVDGGAADGGSALPSISADGRYVAFASHAGDLVARDLNGVDDVFVRDMATGRTVRVSVTSRGTPGRADSRTPTISDDGRRVAFESLAALVPDDRNGHFDVYVHDLDAGTTVRVSDPAGRVEGDGPSFSASLSGDGQSVAFTSMATNLVPGDTNGTDDAFVADVATGALERVSVRRDGSGATGFASITGLRSMSADGRLVLFVSSDGGLVAGDTNEAPDVFVRDRVLGTTTLVTAGDGGAASDGWPGLASISRDGRYAAFGSDATNLVPGDTNGTSDVFLRDLVGGTTRIVSTNGDEQADGPSDWPAITDGGTAVVFHSSARNLGGTGTDPYGDPLTHVYLRRLA